MEEEKFNKMEIDWIMIRKWCEIIFKLIELIPLDKIWNKLRKRPKKDFIECEFCKKLIRFETRICPYCRTDFRNTYEPNAKGWHKVIPLFQVHQFGRIGRTIEYE